MPKAGKKIPDGRPEVYGARDAVPREQAKFGYIGTMPIYEYSCDDCGTKFEKLVRRAGAESINCPSCGQDHLTTEYSTFAAQTKGSSNDAGACQPAGGCGAGMCGGGMCGMNMN